jgi:hypothetical protein
MRATFGVLSSSSPQILYFWDVLDMKYMLWQVSCDDAGCGTGPVVSYNDAAVLYSHCYACNPLANNRKRLCSHGCLIPRCTREQSLHLLRLSTLAYKPAVAAAVAAIMLLPLL